MGPGLLLEKLTCDEISDISLPPRCTTDIITEEVCY
jgi:hypothetical protein